MSTRIMMTMMFMMIIMMVVFRFERWPSASPLNFDNHVHSAPRRRLICKITWDKQTINKLELTNFILQSINFIQCMTVDVSIILSSSTPFVCVSLFYQNVAISSNNTRTMVSTTTHTLVFVVLCIVCRCIKVTMH